ncbi:hypothetical protein D1815_06280 [Aquimarina sp. AD1]|uniref:hypothetical protein n=1 Tax=Aquimarina sp. (strain AD1) TaxID=1714848 RepID=UPI000E5301CD|nr:hypothetical protein [Aquimarina sp. AD1]AXT55382.1 hypothetical protein D1815_06280 [Aquimarina sp. AD1]RKN28708.1 hypothetical protein D7035_07675 [Aquimarina sp. AD1]
MIIYLSIIEIALVVYTFYEGYRYFSFKYLSLTIDATVILCQADKAFQTVTSRFLKGTRQVMKVGLSYKIDGKSYSEIQKVPYNPEINLGSTIPLKILKNNPNVCSLHKDIIRLRRLMLALIFLIFWSVLSYVILKTS